MLKPEDFGLIAMALVFISLFTSIADFGLSKALIQKKENNTLLNSSVFYFSLLSGLIFFIVFQFTAPLISNFYDINLIAPLIKWLSFIFIFNSISTVHLALLSRNLAFKQINIRNFIASAISGVVGLILALNNFGIYSLVVQQILTSLINCITLWYISKWRPTWEFSWSALKTLFPFSFYMFLNQISNRIINQIDIFIIGKFFNPSILGYFGKANSLLNLVKVYSSQSLNKVLFPLLSKYQTNKIKFEYLYFASLKFVNFASFLLSGILIISGKEIILGLLGEQWLKSVSIFQILSLKIFTFPTNSILLTALKAKGFAKQDFYYGLFRKIIKLSAFLFAIFISFEAFLYASVVASYISTLFNYILCSIALKIPFWQHCKELTSFGIIFMFSLLFINVLNLESLINNLYIGLILNILSYIALYIITSFLFKRDTLMIILKSLHN